MARRRRQALTGASYELREDGLVKVTIRTGEGGICKADETWVEGELPHAASHRCTWLAGPQLPSRRRAALKSLHD
jgi:hypothetical protein